MGPLSSPTHRLSKPWCLCLCLCLAPAGNRGPAASGGGPQDRKEVLALENCDEFPYCPAGHCPSPAESLPLAAPNLFHPPLPRSPFLPIPKESTMMKNQPPNSDWTAPGIILSLLHRPCHLILYPSQCGTSCLPPQMSKRGCRELKGTAQRGSGGSGL